MRRDQWFIRPSQGLNRTSDRYVSKIDTKKFRVPESHSSYVTRVFLPWCYVNIVYVIPSKISPLILLCYGAICTVLFHPWREVQAVRPLLVIGSNIFMNYQTWYTFLYRKFVFSL